MSCEHNRAHYFAAVAADGLSAKTLERYYQANRRKPASSSEAISAEAKTRALFAEMQAMGLKPPTHAKDGLPRQESQLGYAAIYDLLQKAQEHKEQEQRLAVHKLDQDDRQGLDIYGRDAEGYDRWGYDADGYDRNGRDREGYDAPGYKMGRNRHGYNKKGYDKDGFNALGFDKSGHDRHGYDYRGYDTDGYDRDGFNLLGYDREGYDRAGYNQEGYDRDGNRHSFFIPDENGLYGDGRDEYGFDANGYTARGYDRYGFNEDGVTNYGFDYTGRTRNTGLDRHGRDTDGYDKNGYREDPQSGRVVDCMGYDEDGLDEKGRAITGYDKDAFDQNGQPRTTRYTIGKSGKPLKANYCKGGWDQDGYDRWGFHKDDGLTYPDAHGKRHNWMGWVYDPDTKKCSNPDDPAQCMDWDHSRFTYLDIGKSRYYRGIMLPDGTQTGRAIPKQAATWVDQHGPYQPKVRPPGYELSIDEFTRTQPSFRQQDSIRDEFEACQRGGVRDNTPESSLANRWQISDERAQFDVNATAAAGVLLRCPHCGQFTSGSPHNCPPFQNRRVNAYPSGAVVGVKWGGTLDPGQLFRGPNDHQGDADFPDGYNEHGIDRDGCDRQGYDRDGYNMGGYSREGFDRLGYDRDGYNRDGYDREGKNRSGARRPVDLASAERMLDGDQDLLSNEDLANMYSRIATGLVGQRRRVLLEEGGGFGTDMRGTITADPYPLGRDASPQANLVVTRAGIHHELGHELLTPPELWAQALEVSRGEQQIEGLGDAAGILPTMFNLVEDGRMERQLSRRYAGVSEVLAASCRLEPRWDEQVGDGVPLSHQLIGASLYTALPFFRVGADVENGMSPKARQLYDEFRPVIRGAVNGTAEDAFDAAVYISRRLGEEGLAEKPPEMVIRLKPPPDPPPGTRSRQSGAQNSSQGAGSSGGSNQEGDPKGNGAGSRARSDEQDDGPQGAGSRGGVDQDDDPQGKGYRGLGQDDDPKSAGSRSGSGQDGDPQGKGRRGAGELDDDSQGKGNQEGDPQGSEHRGSGGIDGDIRSVGELDDEFAPMDDDRLSDILADIERETSQTIESGIGRRNTPNSVGRRLHRPLPAEDGFAKQQYYRPDGSLASADVYFLKNTDAALLQALAERDEEHRRVAGTMATQLKRIKEQAAVRLRRQSEGKLDRRQLANAIKGMDEVRTRLRDQDKTSFAVSIGLDQSGSMSGEIQSMRLYDATLTLARTFEMLDMPYEVRGFGTGNAEYKAMDSRHFEPERAAVLASQALGGTRMRDTAGLASQALIAREESNRLFISLTDGELGDHEDTVSIMGKARRQGVVTFGIYLGDDPKISDMDEIYGRGNWTTIRELSDMPKMVGQRIATIFRALR